MTLFVDASAIVAIVAGEAEGDEFACRIRDDADPLWSAMAGWEAIVSLSRGRGLSFDVAVEEVELMAAARPFRLVPIAKNERQIALQAYARYGKGTGHPAGLNLGDCFAYACAKTNGAGLLYKGNDFSHTDLG